jgi:hypothetical protein
MEHIEFALSVLRSGIFNLKRELDDGHFLPKQEEEIMQDIQKLNRAIMDIQKQFNS